MGENLSHIKHQFLQEIVFRWCQSNFFAGTEVSGLLIPVMGYLVDRFGFYSSFAIAGTSMAAVVVVCSLFLWRNRK